MKAEKIVTTTKSVDLDIQDITLLTVEEAKVLPVNIRKCDEYWWLRSPGNDDSFAAFVDDDGGNVDDDGGNVGYALGVRPVLKISNLTQYDFQVGNKVNVLNHTWTVVSENLILCDNIVGRSPFRKDWSASDANDYAKSDVKEWLWRWYLGQKVRG